jgi:malonyl-CoA decarboxylase
MDKPNFLKRLLGSVTQANTALSAADARKARQVIARCHALLSERGEASGASLARETLADYQVLEGASLEAFFDLLRKEFAPDPKVIGRAAEAYRDDPSEHNLIRLQQVVEAPRQELFRRLNMAPGGTAMLVDMRRRLLLGLKKHPQWASSNADLGHLLASWFNRGFLTLQRIDWRTSAIILEKLIQYEAVHQIQGWDDLRRRLQADRRCYAFFHPALPDEPVIFIEVALTHGMSAKVQPLLDPASPISDTARADCAIFYSITNCQEGLRGISFGNFLIKQVADDLGREFPRLKTFATLSPIPGFRKWLAGDASKSANEAQGREITLLLAHLDDTGWFQDKGIAAVLQQPLTQLCAHYLLHAKHGEEPLDPVARFHLSNGARLDRIDWLGDTSEAGMVRSAGLMVNYVYKLADVEANHEAYVKERRVIASSRLEKLARDATLSSKGTKAK